MFTLPNIMPYFFVLLGGIDLECLCFLVLLHLSVDWARLTIL